MPSIELIIDKLDRYLKTERAEYYAILNPPITDASRQGFLHIQNELNRLLKLSG